MWFNVEEILEIVELIVGTTIVAGGLIALINSKWWCKLADKIL